MTKRPTETSADNADDDEVPEMTTTHRDEDVLEVDDAAQTDSAEGGADAEAGEPRVEAAGESIAAKASDGDAKGEDADDPPKKPRRTINWARVAAFGVLPALALVLALGAGYLKWIDSTNRDSQTARIESVQTARDSTVALLSYTPADVQTNLAAARDLLTGQFRDAYTGLTNDVVIPGALQQQITAVATVPAASSVSATADHAVALVFVNQSTTVGTGAPTDLASTVRVTLDKVDGRWLISQFDPV